MKVAIQKIREDFAREQLQEVMHILSSREACRRKRDALIDVAETHTSGLVNKDDVGILAPSVFIVYGTVAKLIDRARSQFAHQPKHA